MAKKADAKSSSEELELLRRQVAQLQQQVDQLKGREEAARQEKERLQAVLEDMPVMIDAFDAAGRIVLWNRECERVTGYSAAEVIGNPDAMALMAPDPAYRQRKLQEWRELGDDYRDFIFEMTAKDGTVKAVAWSNISARVPIAPWKTWGIGVDLTERREREKRVAESEERFRTIFENAADGFLVADIQTGRFRMANKAICDLTGYSADEIVQLSVRDLHPEESVRDVLETFEEQAGGRLPLAQNIPVKTKGGRVIYVDIHAIHLTLDGTRYIMGVFRDVTERRQRERAVAESEERFRTLFENAPDGIVLVDTQTRRYRMANKAMCDLIGCDADEMTRLGVEDLHPAENLPEVLDVFERGVRSGTSQFHNFPVKTREGRIRYVDIRGIPLTLEGRPFRIAIFRDVTEQRQLVERLQKSEERYRALVESAGETIAVVDQEGRFLFMNTTAAARLGGKPEDYTGKTMWELFSPQIADRQMTSIRKVIQTGQGMNVIVPTNPGGAMRWYNTTIEPLSEGNGEMHSALIIGRDIHELRQAQKELEEYRSHMAGAERLASLGTLSATVAHEMNQPLTVLRLTLQDCLTQLERKGSLESIAADLQDCLEEISVAASIVDRFKSFARHSSRRKSGRTNLQQTAERVVRLWEDAAGRQNVRMALEGLDHLGEIDADAGDMEQVFFSLLENAVQAADGVKPHRLLVRGVVGDGSLEIHFSDDCGGIAPENVGRIFEPFFTTKSHDQGTGLGLCIVEQALSRAGGKIRVENRPGEGVTFVVTLPKAPKRV